MKKEKENVGGRCWRGRTESILSASQGGCLDGAIHVVQMGKRDGLLIVECIRRRPGLHRDTAHDHSGGIDRDGAWNASNDQQLSHDTQPLDQRRESVVGQSCCQSQLGSAQGSELLAGVTLGSIDVFMCV